MFQKGLRSGFGRFDFVEDKVEGNGKTLGCYQGEWQAGKYHGNGRIVWGSTQCSYKGEWWNGKMHGFGAKTDDRTGQILQQGHWENDEFQAEVVVCNNDNDGTATETERPLI